MAIVTATDTAMATDTEKRAVKGTVTARRTATVTATAMARKTVTVTAKRAVTGTVTVTGKRMPKLTRSSKPHICTAQRK